MKSMYRQSPRKYTVVRFADGDHYDLNNSIRSTAESHMELFWVWNWRFIMHACAWTTTWVYGIYSVILSPGKSRVNWPLLYRKKAHTVCLVTLDRRWDSIAGIQRRWHWRRRFRKAQTATNNWPWKRKCINYGESASTETQIHSSRKSQIVTANCTASSSVRWRVETDRRHAISQPRCA